MLHASIDGGAWKSKIDSDYEKRILIDNKTTTD